MHFFHPLFATPSFLVLTSSRERGGASEGLTEQFMGYFWKCSIACWSHLYIDYYILFVRIFTEHNPESGI